MGDLRRRKGVGLERGTRRILGAIPAALPLLDLLRDQASYAHPLVGRDICREIGIPNAEQLRELVNWLRSKGDPLFSRIDSDTRGYYLIREWREAQPTIEQPDGRIIGMQNAIRGLSRAFNQDEKQVGMAL